jgi:hypothetical protein
MRGRIADITDVTLGAVVLMPSRRHFAGCYRHALFTGERNPDNSENTQLSGRRLAAIVGAEIAAASVPRGRSAAPCGAPAWQEEQQWLISGLQSGIAGVLGVTDEPQTQRQ